MFAIILNAGSATRLGSITKTLPKALLKINKNSILEIQIKNFQEFGLSEFVVIVGPNKEKFSQKNIHLVVDAEFNSHEQLGSLLTAEKFLESGAIVSFGDVLTEKKIIQQMVNSSFDIGLAIDLDWKRNYIDRSLHPESQADLVKLESGKITKIQKNLSHTPDEKIGEFIGIMKLSKNGGKIFVDTYNNLLKSHRGTFHTAKSFQQAFLTDLIQELISQNISINPILIDGNWCEIDTSEDLEKARTNYQYWM